ncbi:MAG: zf-HC2 domain-containing protein [Planctomycetes bacterium]|nr:zf-HC2 domain-containing protein [Planctomycetota bacterium]MBI3846733.1 zf-HC2 domain-containing protein [Planctomycetota bacterium]
MRCTEVRAQLDALVDSRLDAATGSDIEVHVESCPECRRLLAEMRTVDDDVRGRLRAERMPDDAWSRIEARLQTEPRRTLVPRRFATRVAALAAAACLVAAVLWIVDSSGATSLAAAAVRDHLSYEKSRDLGPGAARTIEEAEALLENRLGLTVGIPKLGDTCGVDMQFVGARPIGDASAPAVQAFFTCCGRPVSVIFTRDAAVTDCQSMQCVCGENGLQMCTLVRGDLRAFFVARDHVPSELASQF